MRELVQKLAPIALVAILALFGLTACGGQPESDAAGGDAPALEQESADDAMHEGEGMEGEEGEGEEGEHSEGGEHGEEGEGGEGEESGEYLGRDETWDATRRGARLTLSFDPARGVFAGTVENTTEATLCAVRIEVHLAGGPELGPTERTDLEAGQSVAVELSAGGESFESWTAHPEMSACG